MKDDQEYPEPPDQVFEGEEARRRFEVLDLKAEWLRRAVYRGYLAFRDTSHPHFPRTIAPINEWGFTNKFLRDALVPVGWTYGGKQGVPVTIAPDNSHAITATSGNSFTGIRDRTPSTRHPRGAISEGLIEENSQLDLFPIKRGAPGPPTGRRTRYLLLLPVPGRRGMGHSSRTVPPSCGRRVQTHCGVV